MRKQLYSVLVGNDITFSFKSQKQRSCRLKPRLLKNLKQVDLRALCNIRGGMNTVLWAAKFQKDQRYNNKRKKKHVKDLWTFTGINVKRYYTKQQIYNRYYVNLNNLF